MVILKKGDCEHCGRIYRYSLWDCEFGKSSYAYCDRCGKLALLNYANPQVAALPPLKNQHAEIDQSWEQFLEPCDCEGTFRRGSSPRCPYCNQQLSPTHVAAQIEAQTQGTNKAWHWQNDWKGPYCLAIDDPQNPGVLRQMIDPVAKPEVAKPKSRWLGIFNF